MGSTRRVLLLVVLVFTGAVVTASFYTLNHVREEAYRQAGLDMERRIKTFWELLRAKGDQFRIRNGQLYAGDYLINNNFELPDKIKNIFGGTATIFMGDVRVTTNVPREDGSRAVGTRLVGPAYHAIFEQGVPYRGEADILGRPYFTAYDPIRNGRGDVIGALYVGVEKSLFLAHYNRLLLGFLAPILFLASVTTALYCMLLKEGRQARRVQAHSMYFLQALIDSLPMPIFYKDSQGRYLGCNDAFANTFNISQKSIVGKTVYDVSPAGYATHYAYNDQSLFEAPPGEKQQYETKIFDAAQGTDQDVIFYKARFYDEQGKLGGLIGAMLNITDRKQTEERLRASEQQTSDIISFLPDATWVIDQRGCILAWNKACAELTGLTAEQMVGRCDYAHAMPFYGRQRPMLIDGALTGDSLVGLDYYGLEQGSDVVMAESHAPYLRGGKGAYVWAAARRLFDANGEVVGAIETVRDVTERKQCELRERARANILEHIAKNTSLEEVLTAIVRDIELEHPEIYCSILLANKEGTRLMYAVAPSLPDAYNQAVSGIKIKDGVGSCGTAASRRQRVVVADIQQHPYWENFTPAQEAGLRSCWSEPILGSSGELYGTFALYSRKVWEPGVEEIRLIETAANYASIAIERMKTVTALRESELNYRELVENANSIILRFDPRGRLTFFNEFAQQFFGYREQEILGQHVIGTIVPPYESSGRNLAEMIAEICAHPEKYALNENENMRKNGERVYVSWSNKAIRGADGALEEILCVGQDMTERKQMQEVMVQTEKMMTVGGLAAGMAHELNNPIGSIAQNAQNIIRRVSGDLPANRSVANEVGIELSQVSAYLERRGIPEMLAAIRTSCERAATIIANMLTFSRKSTSRFEATDLARLVEKTIELAIFDYDLKKQYDFKNIRLVREFEPELPPVPVVPMEIEQVLLNLLKNAAQVLAEHPPAAAQPTITLRLRHDQYYLMLEVEDNGPGIPTEKRNRVFEPFFTTREVGVGTGLGLSISYSIIVNNHHGSINVSSPPGKGACFTVKLPLQRAGNTGLDTPDKP